jgi:predicted O-linked N-acetylglucosamine transferase (SPINDLY family)
MQPTQPHGTALAMCARGDFPGAAQWLEEFVREAPDDVGAWLLLSRLGLQMGSAERAHRAALAVISMDSRNAEALYLRGRAEKLHGDLAAAESSYRLAIAADSRNTDALVSLGLLLRASGRAEEALTYYRSALDVKPEHAEARKNLVNALVTIELSAGRPLAPGLTQPPSIETQLRALADRLAGRGELRDAFFVVQETLQANPTSADLWFGAGTLALEMGLMAMSLRCCEQALKLDAGFYRAILLARRLCVGSGLDERAIAHAKRACVLAPSPDLVATQNLVLPAVAASAQAYAQARSRYESALDGVLAGDWRPQDPYNTLQIPNFFLAYHGEKEVDLQIKAARACLRAIPDLEMTAAHCRSATRRPGRIRVGFVSRYFANHSIGKTTRGFLDRLSRDQFEVYLLRITPSVEDDMTRLMAAAADHTWVLDKDVPRAREQIAALELDVLFYQDIGMESTSWFLAFARLAPVQCVSFGHPCTTGIPNMDYFISNDLFELPDAQANYSERLFLLRDLPTLAYYYAPPIPEAPFSRAELGLPENSTLYLCPQTLFKLHPDFDECLAGILRGDPLGYVVLIRGDFDEWTRSLQERLLRSMPDVVNRILFLPVMPHAGYLRLLAAANVVLDPVHFNGMNSSLESFAVGTPVVTLPTRLQRGRHTQAMYRKMELPECIAADRADYVRTALRLGTDAAYNKRVREQILARNHVLFENDRVISEFERFFAESVASAVSGER